MPAYQNKKYPNGIMDNKILYNGSYLPSPNQLSASNQISAPAPLAVFGDPSEVNQFGLSSGIVPTLMSDGTYQTPAPQNNYGGQMDFNFNPGTLAINPIGTTAVGEPKQEPVTEFNSNQNTQNNIASGVGNSMGMFSSILGQSIGNAKSGKGSKSNTLRGVGAGLGLASGLLSQGMSLFRTGSAASAAAQRNNWVQQQAQKKLAEERLGNPVAAAAGGVVTNNDTRIVPVTGASGEFIAPQENGGNVNMELGESVKIPGDPIVKESLGERHEDGGNQTSVPDGTKILSDRLKLSEDQAAAIRDRFGLKVTPKMTYAEVQSKYKKKIGLSDALDEMQALSDKLEKNNKNVKDKNTARLNESVLSKRMNEVQSTIDSLSEEDSSFFDVLFDYQEQDKRKELENYYFGEGGVVDKKEFENSIREFGLTEEQAKEYWLDKAMKGEFAVGGRYMEFVPVYNKFRTENETYGRDGYQPLVNGAYGRVSEWGDEAIMEMARLFPELTRGNNRIINIQDGKASWVDPNNTSSNARTIERVVNGAYGGLNALSDVISNYKDIRNNLVYGFSDQSQAGPAPQNSTEYAHNERAGEGKLGEYHMSRSLGGLRVVTPEQLKQLNDAGIRNYSDLLANEAEGRKILGDDFGKLSELRSREGASGLDFVLMDYAPNAELLRAPSLASDPKSPDLSPIGQRNIPNGTPLDKGGDEGRKDDKKKEVGRTNAGMPWLFNSDAGLPAPSAMDPSYLNQVRMMRSEPVLRSADQAISTIDQTTNAQLGSLNDLADSQRAAYTAFIGSQANDAKARAIADVDLFNAEQRNRASELNEQRYLQTEAINAELREKYEDKVLQGKAASEDAWFSYWQNMRDQQLVNDEARIKAAVLSNIFPNSDIFGNYVGNNEFVGSKNVQAEKDRYEQEMEALDRNKKKGGSSSSTKKAKK